MDDELPGGTAAGIRCMCLAWRAASCRLSLSDVLGREVEPTADRELKTKRINVCKAQRITLNALLVDDDRLCIRLMSRF